MRYSFLILFIFALAACYTAKQANRQLDKAHAKYPAITAQKNTDWYPVIEGKPIEHIVYKEGETQVRYDTVLDYHEIPGTTQYQTVYKTITRIDTIKKTDTIYKTNNAALQVWILRNDSANKEIAKRDLKYQATIGADKVWKYVCGGLGFMIFLLLVVAIKSRRK